MNSKTTTIAAASCAALLAGVSTAALAQIGQPLIQPQGPATFANPLIFPKLEVVNGVSRTGSCESVRFGGYDLYRKGVDTSLEIVSGDTGLVMTGPDMDKTTSIRIRRDDGTTVTGTIERRIAKDAVCSSGGTGFSAIVVRFAIPDTTTVVRGTIEIFGKKERLLQINPAKAPTQMCDLGEIGVVPCPQAEPAVVAALDLKIVPRPQTTAISPSTDRTISGDRFVQVVTLTGQRMGLAKLDTGPGISLASFNNNATSMGVTYDFFLSPNSDRRVEPRIGVELRRGGQVQLVTLWDTAGAGGDSASRKFNKLGFIVRRGAAEPPRDTPPPAAAAANLDPFDPGNTLYVVGSGNTTTSGNFQQIYHALTREEHCSGITVPAVKPPPNQNVIEANEREVTVPDIRYGVINRGNAAAPAGTVVELRLSQRVVASFTINQPIAAGQTVLAPAFRRPDSTNTVARLTGGGVCYHKGQPSDGWNDNGGYTITLLGTNEVKRID
ncbi:MAG: hypothetical protein JWR84_1116 [Caulobacter sp.]|nr:hypothetical protein [Caulobacter sp.]